MKKEKEPKSIVEVRIWKETVAKEVRLLSTPERIAYFNEAAKNKLKKAA